MSQIVREDLPYNMREAIYDTMSLPYIRQVTNSAAKFPYKKKQRQAVRDRYATFVSNPRGNRSSSSNVSNWKLHQDPKVLTAFLAAKLLPVMVVAARMLVDGKEPKQARGLDYFKRIRIMPLGIGPAMGETEGVRLMDERSRVAIDVGLVDEEHDLSFPNNPYKPHIVNVIWNIDLPGGKTADIIVETDTTGYRYRRTIVYRGKGTFRTVWPYAGQGASRYDILDDFMGEYTQYHKVLELASKIAFKRALQKKNNS